MASKQVKSEVKLADLVEKVKQYCEAVDNPHKVPIVDQHARYRAMQAAVKS